MRLAWLAPLVLPAIAIVGLMQTSSHPREQTVFLERVASRLEHVRTIPPETERALRETIRSIRRAGPPSDEQLDARQRFAIQKIENTLWNHTGALGAQPQDAMAAAPARPRFSVSADSDDSPPGKPLRPLYPFRSEDQLPGARPDCCTGTD